MFASEHILIDLSSLYDVYVSSTGLSLPNLASFSKHCHSLNVMPFGIK